MKQFVVFVDETYEELELWYPKLRLEEAGHKVVVAGPKERQTYKGKHGYPCVADIGFEAINNENFSGVVIPGGFAPDKLRRVPTVLQHVSDFFKAGKIVAYICHGGWVAISAKIVRGKKVTGAEAIKDDLENAGGHWLNQSVVVDGNLISSRKPADLPDFTRAILEKL